MLPAHNKDKPINVAVSTLAFPLIALMLGNLLFFYTEQATTSLGLAAVVYWPWDFVAISLLGVGTVFAALRGMSVFRILAGTPFSYEKLIASAIALSVIAVGAIELLYLAFSL